MPPKPSAAASRSVSTRERSSRHPSARPRAACGRSRIAAPCRGTPAGPRERLKSMRARIISGGLAQSNKPLCLGHELARHDRTGKCDAARGATGRRPALDGRGGRHGLPHRRCGLGAGLRPAARDWRPLHDRRRFHGCLVGRFRPHDPAAPASDACWSPAVAFLAWIAWRFAASLLGHSGWPFAIDLLGEAMLAAGFCGYMASGVRPNAYYRRRLPKP